MITILKKAREGEGTTPGDLPESSSIFWREAQAVEAVEAG